MGIHACLEGVQYNQDTQREGILPVTKHAKVYRSWQRSIDGYPGERVILNTNPAHAFPTPHDMHIIQPLLTLQVIPKYTNNKAYTSRFFHNEGKCKFDRNEPAALTYDAYRSTHLSPLTLPLSNNTKVRASWAMTSCVDNLQTRQKHRTSWIHTSCRSTENNTHSTPPTRPTTALLQLAAGR
ncbi:unnamed protein product [Ectocarpus sp. 12 AP-2014]